VSFVPGVLIKVVKSFLLMGVLVNPSTSVFFARVIDKETISVRRLLRRVVTSIPFANDLTSDLIAKVLVDEFWSVFMARELRHALKFVVLKFSLNERLREYPNYIATVPESVRKVNLEHTKANSGG
jgi:hypothetical protein